MRIPRRNNVLRQMTIHQGLHYMPWSCFINATCLSKFNTGELRSWWWRIQSTGFCWFPNKNSSRFPKSNSVPKNKSFFVRGLRSRWSSMNGAHSFNVGWNGNIREIKKKCTDRVITFFFFVFRFVHSMSQQINRFLKSVLWGGHVITVIIPTFLLSRSNLTRFRFYYPRFSYRCGNCLPGCVVNCVCIRNFVDFTTEANKNFWCYEMLESFSLQIGFDSSIWQYLFLLGAIKISNIGDVWIFHIWQGKECI